MPDNLQPTFEKPTTRLAPTWHTFALLILLVLLATVRHGHVSAEELSHHSMLYLGSIVNGWMLLAVVVAGLYQRKDFFQATLIANARPWGVELLRAGLVFLTYIVGTGLIFLALRHTHFRDTINAATIAAMTPRSMRELLLWLLVSLTAGFCEEHIFRGYLLQQCRAWLLRRKASNIVASGVSVVFTAVSFGALHMYEGLGGVVLVMLLGSIFAMYALRFGNLRAVMLAHFLQDFIVGALHFARHARGM